MPDSTGDFRVRLSRATCLGCEPYKPTNGIGRANPFKIVSETAFDSGWPHPALTPAGHVASAPVQTAYNPPTNLRRFSAVELPLADKE